MSGQARASRTRSGTRSASPRARALRRAMCGDHVVSFSAASCPPTGPIENKSLSTGCQSPDVVGGRYFGIQGSAPSSSDDGVPLDPSGDPVRGLDTEKSLVRLEDLDLVPLFETRKLDGADGGQHRAPHAQAA